MDGPGNKEIMPGSFTLEISGSTMIVFNSLLLSDKFIKDKSIFIVPDIVCFTIE